MQGLATRAAGSIGRGECLVAAALLLVLACAAPAEPGPKASAPPPGGGEGGRAAGTAPGPAVGGAPAAAAEQPRRGGELVFIVSAEPPSFDAHRESTFAMLHWTAPHYSLLVKFDPDNYPNVIGDVAESWTISPDGLTYQFKLRNNVRFHDGSLLTARDVKATYDKIIFPPPGVVSARQATYSAVESVEAPDEHTVIFRLKYPQPAMLAFLASPWNFIYKADILERDPRWYEKNILGSGPFRFVEYVPGSHWIGKRNEDYFLPDRPYLDGFRAIFVRDLAAQVAAIRGGRAHIEFRGFPPPARDDLVRAMGKDIVVQESPWTCSLYVVFNTERRPFDDPRVRRALSLAVDRWEGSQALSQIALVKEVGGLQRPGAPFAMPESELVKLAGFSRDINAAREQARRLLREAGIPEGWSFTLKNRDIPMPYEPVGIFLVDQWRRIGLNVNHLPQETGPFTNDLRAGEFEASLDFNCDYLDEPDLQLAKFLSAHRSPANFGRYNDPVLDDLYDRQSRELNPEARKQLVWQYERRVLDEQAYVMTVLWWHRIIPHAAAVKGWKITPSHYVNQDLSTIWLAQ
ncbi:MAG TPA: ABC transporter substrate-binding protein [Chloroflexota bacterium]|nr:ABC transporter substrate-binding protein [Chloroflexota bacterium]